MSSKYERFVRIVWSYYEEHGRHTLPWRKTKDPYRILVSEVMLQQTQVERVLLYYKAWLKAFPSVDVLAQAPLSQVLSLWQGLGYNRRAKNVQRACKEIVALSSFPKTVPELESLPGVGPYTARAVSAFAYNTPVILVETNIRTAVLHHFFNDTASRIHEGVTDGQIEDILAKVLPQGKSREWYYALMDYGAYLKRSGVRLNKKAKGYTKQKSFKGSTREARGSIIQALTKASCTEKTLVLVLGKEREEQVRLQLETLLREGMVVKEGRRYSLPN